MMIKAIPTGRKTLTLPPIAPTIMKGIPLIEKNIAAVLYDFEFLDGLLLIVQLLIHSIAYLSANNTTAGIRIQEWKKVNRLLKTC